MRDDMPKYLTNLGESRIGGPIEELAENWHPDRQRCQQMIDVCRPQSPKRARLRDYPTAIVNREKAAGYLDYLDHVREQFDGEKVVETSIERAGGILYYSSEWHKPDLQTVVNAFRQELESAMRWFNIQMLAYWVAFANSRERLWFCQGIDEESLIHECNSIDRYTYAQANHHYALAFRRWEADLPQVPGLSQEMVDLLVLSDRVLIEMVKARWGYEPDMSVLEQRPRPPKEEVSKGPAIRSPLLEAVDVLEDDGIPIRYDAKSDLVIVGDSPSKPKTTEVPGFTKSPVGIYTPG